MSESMTSSSLLRIDEVRILEGLTAHIRKILDAHNADKVLIGLSGGIDSCLLAAIAVQALGKRFVHAAYLYDHHSANELRRNVRLVSDWLGIETEEKSIEPLMRDLGVYSSPEMRMTSYSGALNRLLQRVYGWIHGESPFVSSLRRGGTAGSADDAGSPGFQGKASPIESAFNSRHIYRRRFLEAEAMKRKCALLGAANRTEWLTGWFVRGGIDDLPDQPLLGLYKTQIRQLSAFLNLPSEVQSARPSPDMMKGITDEHSLGVRYSHIDLALDCLEGGVTKEEIVGAGVTEKEIQLVAKMKRLSAWKRCSRQNFSPVDGGPSGGLRLALGEKG
jgi:NAD+ synthase